MRTLIDGVEVAVQWNTEKNLTEVQASLDSWLLPQGFQISSLLVNGKSAPQEDYPLANISLLEVDTVPIQEKTLRDIKLFRDFLTLAVIAFHQNKSSTVSDFENEFRLMEPHVYPLLNPLKGQIHADVLVLKEPWKNEHWAISAQRICDHLNRWIKEWENPHQAFEETLQEISRILPEFKEMAILFQRGLDKKALDLLLEGLTLVEALNRQAELPGNQGLPLPTQWKTLGTEMAGFLMDIHGALAQKDYVLLSDLVEYEISPRLELLLDRVQSLT